MEKKDLIKKVKNNFDLIPEYFFNTFQKKIFKEGLKVKQTKEEFLKEIEENYDLVPEHFKNSFKRRIQERKIASNELMNKDKFIKAIEEHFNLIPSYFFNTLQTKIDAHNLDSETSTLLDFLPNHIKPTKKTKDFEYFVKLDWLLDLIRRQQGMEVTEKNLKKVLDELGFVKGNFYFKKAGYEYGVFVKYKSLEIESFFRIRRSYYLNGINQ